jgi:multidrug efflux pump subunit AcrA (membrane-fusion protein)
VVVRQEVSVSSPDGGVVTGISTSINKLAESDEPIAYLFNVYHFRLVTQTQSTLINLDGRIQADLQLGSFKEYSDLSNYIQSLLTKSIQSPGELSGAESAVTAKIAEFKNLIESIEDSNELSASAQALSEDLIESTESVIGLISSSSEPRILAANYDGYVTEILVSNGDTVLPGASLAKLQLEPALITAYLLPEEVESLADNQSVEISCFSETISGTIKLIGMNLVSLPDVLSGNPYDKSMGIPVTIQPDHAIQWPTGVPVTVRLP